MRAVYYEKGLYEAQEISPAALKRLSGLASRQIDRLVAPVEQMLTGSGATMLDELVGSCLAKINLEYQVSLEEFKASLVGVGFYPLLAQAIALSWQAATARLQTMPIHILPGLNLAQTMRRAERPLCPIAWASCMKKSLTRRCGTTGCPTPRFRAI